MAGHFSLQSDVLRLSDAVEAVNEHFHAEGLTDGLPIIPPTPEAVRRMLTYTDLDPQDVVAIVPPMNGQATVEKIAINAVMAGCLPQYLPVVITAVHALADDAFNLYGILATTHPCSNLVIVNGPIAQELAINAGYNVLGQGWRSNASIGRAVRLIMTNVGGALPGTVDRATQGSPAKYTYCFAENQSQSPWEPFHVTQGFKPTDSTVSVFSLWSVISSRGGYWGGLNHAYTAAQEYCFMVQNINLHRSACTIIMDPIVAKYCYDDGFDTQSKLMTYISENATISAGLYWASDHVAGFNMPAARQALEPYSSYLKAAQRDPNTLIKPFFNPKRMNVLVAGGSTQAISFVTDGSLVKCISIDKWK